MVTVGIAINAIKAIEGNTSQILGRWYAIKDDRFVSWQVVQEINNCCIAGKREKCMIPFVQLSAAWPDP